MNHANHKTAPIPAPDNAASLVYATVRGRVGQWFFFDAGSGAVQQALRAQSCLIEPDCGDTVLACAGDDKSAAYILAVLTRADAASATLALPGGAALHTDRGALRVEAAQVALHAPEIVMEGARGEMRFERVDASIRYLHAGLGAVSTVAQQITTTAGRLIQRARDSLRWIDNADETRAGRVRVRVDERMHVSARHATILAEGQVKIDASKIDLG